MTLNLYTDFRLGGVPEHYISEEEDNMQVPDEIRKCVVFLKYRDKAGNEKFAGTAFFVGVQEDEKSEDAFIYLVTAKHVIVAIDQNSIDGKVLIRMNDKQGGFQIVEADVFRWFDNPDNSSVDIMILGWAPPDIYDYRILSVLPQSKSIIATNEVIKKHSIGLGDKLFITGLFVGHYGKSRNIPILRSGNIASMPEERVETKKFGGIEAYLIEARSIGGLSGSPVFVYLDNMRTGTILLGGGDSSRGFGGRTFFLLGVMHGHWDRGESEFDDVTEDVDGGKINMGIGIVIPATKIVEIINQPKLLEKRKTVMNERKKNVLPTEDNLPSEDSPELEDKKQENGITKEEFEDALKNISRPLKPERPRKERNIGVSSFRWLYLNEYSSR